MKKGTTKSLAKSYLSLQKKFQWYDSSKKAPEPL
jgi:hypothetical protein